MAKDASKQAALHDYCEVTTKDLPLSCPKKGERVWDAHPRVYLPIEEEGKVVCPYCDAVYVLKED